MATPHGESRPTAGAATGAARDSFIAEFDPRSNAFNALRLLFAAMVIVQHAALTGGYELPAPLYVLFGELAVDSFFVISGFLLARSWLRRPLWGRYLWHRFVRIFPAFWVCLIVTAAVIAPLAAVISGDLNGFWSDPSGPWAYIWRNSLLWVQQTAISATPADVPLPYEWNASLWTLYWEFLCYLALLVLGVWGVLRRHRWVVLALVAVLVLFHVARVAFADLDAAVSSSFIAVVLPRLLLMFLLGVAFWLYADVVPTSAVFAAASAAFVIAALVGPWDFRVVGAVALAYLVLWAGIRAPVRFGLNHDLSYGLYIYAFPVQQLLAIAGVRPGWLPSVVLALCATLPLAAASWWCVERPFLRLKNWSPGAIPRVDAAEPPAAQGGLETDDKNAPVATALEDRHHEPADVDARRARIAPRLVTVVLLAMWLGVQGLG